jgi:starvation-inducible DNA-binding protein
MFKTISPLPENARAALAASLNERLADGIDLYTHMKVAHWNVKGLHFAALHPLFETFADTVNANNDAIAERAVTLGGRAFGTARWVAQASKIAEYPKDATQGVDHARLLAERLGVYAAGLRDTRAVADKHGDLDTSDMVTGMIEEAEKNAWFLLATTEG